MMINEKESPSAVLPVHCCAGSAGQADDEAVSWWWKSYHEESPNKLDRGERMLSISIEKCICS